MQPNDVDLIYILMFGVYVVCVLCVNNTGDERGLAVGHMLQHHHPNSVVLSRQGIPTLGCTEYGSAEGMQKRACIL